MDRPLSLECTLPSVDDAALVERFTEAIRENPSRMLESLYAFSQTLHTRYGSDFAGNQISDTHADTELAPYIELWRHLREQHEPRPILPYPEFDPDTESTISQNALVKMFGKLLTERDRTSNRDVATEGMRIARFSAFLNLAARVEIHSQD